VAPHPQADRFGQLLGMEVVELGDGRAMVELTAGEQHTNFLGVVHDGALFSWPTRRWRPPPIPATRPRSPRW
jgi:acyl-coenzyme A thioesterase PaaI-like protein